MGLYPKTACPLQFFDDQSERGIVFGLARNYRFRRQMMSKKILALGSVVALFLSSGFASAQVVEIQPVRIKQILGTKVAIQGNTAVGIIDDVVLDDQGQIEYVIVNNEGKMVTVPWSAAKWDLQQRSATINLTQQQYQAIPTYTVQQYPNFYAPTYRTETYKVYGLTPREIRRIERRNP